MRVAKTSWGVRPSMPGLPPTPCYGIFHQEHFSDLVIGTYGRSLWISWTIRGSVQQLSEEGDYVNEFLYGFVVRDDAPTVGRACWLARGAWSSARRTALGSCSMMRRSVAAGPLTRRVPCSHFR